MSSSSRVPKSKADFTLDFFNSIFLSKGFTIKSFEWEGNANNGHGAMSTLERVKLHLTSGKVLSVILKTLPQKDSQLHKITICDGFANRELNMYSTLFPLWEEFLNSRNVDEKFRFRYPKCYYAAFEGIVGDVETYDQILILEDLHASGFKMWAEGRGKSLEWDQAKVCIRLIALFHAVGLAYKETKGIDEYQIEMPFLDHHVPLKKEMFSYFFKSGIQAMKEMIEDYREKAENVQENDQELPLLRLPNGFMDNYELLWKNEFYNLKFLTPKPGQIGTVGHNDLHVNNFMFSISEEDVSHPAIFFDFQASSYTFPTKDLSFFLIQNCDDSLTTTEFNKTIQYYHDELHLALSAMGVPMRHYTLDRMKEEYRSMANLSVLHIIAGAAMAFSLDSGTSEETRRRFYNRLIQMYNEGLLQWKIDPATL